MSIELTLEQKRVLGDPHRSEEEKVAYMQGFGWRDKNYVLHVARKMTKKVVAKLNNAYPTVMFEGHTVAVHRLVVYQYTGDWYKGLTVHHINQDRKDNRPENLYLCTREDHVRIHDGLMENPSTGNLEQYKKVE